MKKTYLGYAPKPSNVVKLNNYLNSSTQTKDTKEAKLPKKGNKKRF